MSGPGTRLPSVSLIAPIHNGGKHYPACFESLCRLDYPAEILEVNIIDDCSTDGTREYLRAQTPPDYMAIHYPPNSLGRSAVRNLGIDLAGGDIIIFLDGDMQVEPDFIRQHAAELARPGREAVIGRVEPAAWLPESKLNRYLYHYPGRGARQFGPDSPVGFQYVLTNNLAVSRAALTAAGTFDAAFSGYGGEDTLFGYQLARAFPNGIFYHEQAVARHHHHRTLRHHLYDFRHYGRHNLPILLQRHPELVTPLAADFAWPLPGPFFRRRRRLGRLLFNPLGRLAARLLLPFAVGLAAGHLIRYLTVDSVVRGLRGYLRSHKIVVDLPGRKPPGTKD